MQAFLESLEKNMDDNVVHLQKLLREERDKRVALQNRYYETRIQNAELERELHKLRKGKSQDRATTAVSLPPSLSAFDLPSSSLQSPQRQQIDQSHKRRVVVSKSARDIFVCD